MKCWVLVLLGAAWLAGCPDDPKIILESPFSFDELERSPPPPTTVTVDANGCGVTTAISGTDRNGPLESRYDPVQSNVSGLLQVNPCGGFGVVFRRDSDGQLVYAEFDGDTLSEETVTPIASGTLIVHLGLFYDSACTPHVIQNQAQGWVEHIREGVGSWLTTPACCDGVSMTLQSVKRDPAGVVNVFGVQATTVYRSTWSEAAGWDSTELGSPTDGTFDQSPDWNFPPDIPPENFATLDAQVLDIAVDADGYVHAALSMNNHLYWARYNGSTWEGEVVYFRPNWDTDAVRGGVSIAVSSGGLPVIAANHRRRGTAGSVFEAQLWGFVRTPSGWQNDLVASASDGYVGNDGNAFTGGSPVIRFDQYDRAYIAYNDVAVWHNAQGWSDEAWGQFRLARFDVDTGWQLTTIFAQQGQATTAPATLEELRHPSMVVTPDGSRLAFIGMERVTQGETLIYETANEVSYALRFCTASAVPDQ